MKLIRILAVTGLWGALGGCASSSGPLRSPASTGGEVGTGSGPQPRIACGVVTTYDIVDGQRRARDDDKKLIPKEGQVGPDRALQKRIMDGLTEKGYVHLAADQEYGQAPYQVHFQYFCDAGTATVCSGAVRLFQDPTASGWTKFEEVQKFALNEKESRRTTRVDRAQALANATRTMLSKLQSCNPDQAPSEGTVAFPAPSAKSEMVEVVELTEAVVPGSASLAPKKCSVSLEMSFADAKRVAMTPKNLENSDFYDVLYALRLKGYEVTNKGESGEMRGSIAMSCRGDSESGFKCATELRFAKEEKVIAEHKLDAYWMDKLKNEDLRFAVTHASKKVIEWLPNCESNEPRNFDPGRVSTTSVRLAEIAAIQSIKPTQALRDPVRKLIWSPEAGPLVWADAEAHCASLATNGLSWRLPTSRDILLAGNDGLIIDRISARNHAFVKIFGMEGKKEYWSSTSARYQKVTIHSDHEGILTMAPPEFPNYVRCVADDR